MRSRACLAVDQSYLYDRSDLRLDKADEADKRRGESIADHCLRYYHKDELTADTAAWPWRYLVRSAHGLRVLALRRLKEATNPQHSISFLYETCPNALLAVRSDTQRD
eukprot:6200139-Pleurochrysis_carterae.AAC.3